MFLQVLLVEALNIRVELMVKSAFFAEFNFQEQKCRHNTKPTNTKTDFTLYSSSPVRTKVKIGKRSFSLSKPCQNIDIKITILGICL